MRHTARWVQAGLWGLCLALAAPLALAQGSASIRLVVPFSTGGPTDIAARVVAPLLGEALGRVVVVDNRVGATGAIGAELVARAAPDGNTILFGTSSIMAANPALVPRLPYDPVQDFAPVSLVATIENILVVHPSVPVRNVQELVRYARERPGQLFYGSSGTGSTYHLGAELFANLTQTRLAHVPYKGQGPAAQDLLAGHIQLMFDAFNSAVPNIRSGHVRALGIASARRHPDLPELPTISEQGVPNYVTTIWLAFFLPAKTPAAATARLQQALAGILQRDEVRERFDRLGMQAVSSTPADLDQLLRAELRQWTRVVREAGIKPD
jgi:tripartite-type tricarboxylate transporter receptor subunit TctC